MSCSIRSRKAVREVSPRPTRSRRSCRVIHDRRKRQRGLAKSCSKRASAAGPSERRTSSPSCGRRSSETTAKTGGRSPGICPGEPPRSALSVGAGSRPTSRGRSGPRRRTRRSSSTSSSPSPRPRPQKRTGQTWRKSSTSAPAAAGAASKSERDEGTNWTRRSTGTRGRSRRTSRSSRCTTKLGLSGPLSLSS
jgi:hypothetical protein